MSAVMSSGEYLRITQHAADRWHERIEPRMPAQSAFQRAETAVVGAVPLKRWVARRFFPDAHSASRCVAFLVTAKAAFIVRGNIVLTVLPFTEEALICVLCWMLFETLPEEYPVFRAADAPFTAIESSP